MTDDVLRLAAARRYSSSGRGRTIREAAELSIADIAREVGVEASTIWRWEAGDRRPRGAAALRWAACLDRLERARRRASDGASA